MGESGAEPGRYSDLTLQSSGIVTLSGHGETARPRLKRREAPSMRASRRL